MPAEIDWGTRIDAEDMYISGGLTYEQVAEKTGVSMATLKRWGSEGGWTERKKELREAQRDIKQKTVMLRLGLIKTAMDGHDPMQVFAAAKFEDLELKKEALRGTISTQGYTETQAQPFTTPGEAVSALQGAIERKIGMMVSGAEPMDSKNFAALKAAMGLMEQLKQKDGAGQDKESSISEERLKEIKGYLKL